MPEQRAKSPFDLFSCPLGGTTLIEASAGTGKTWAITGLVLRLILERGLPVDKVLVVTFTKAATAELRTRIRDRLREVLVCVREGDWNNHPDFLLRGLLEQAMQSVEPEVLVSRLLAALAAFDEAAIYTIHGYCQRALGDAPLTAGQAFELELVNDSALLRQVSADFWREQVACESNPALADFLSRKLTPDMLESQLRRRLARPLAHYFWPQPEAASAEKTSCARHFAQARAAWQNSGTAAKAVLLEAMVNKALDGRSYTSKSVAAAWESWETWFASPDMPFVLPPSKAELFCAHLIATKNSKGKAATEHPLFTTLSELWEAFSALQSDLALARLNLLRQFLVLAPARVRELKQRQRQASFDDLLSNLHQTLHGQGGEALAAHLRQRYPVALIDEFQDTDPLQFACFQRIYMNNEAEAESESETETGAPPAKALFLVGDPKQAIYSFRQADLQTYLHARQFADQRYFLAHNQRSSPPLIAAVNTLFSRHQQPFMLEGLNFQQVGVGEKPRYHLRDDRPCQRGALHVWQRAPEDEPDKTTMEKITALACACEMADLLAASREGLVARVAPDGSERPLLPGDLAVLVRTHAQGRRVKAALAEVGLGASELGTESVFASMEAAELEILLHALNEPNRPEFLRAALASAWLGFDAAAVDELALGGELAVWLLRFQESQHRCVRQGVAVAVHRLLAEWEVIPRLLALREGERKLTNIFHLLELLHSEEENHGQADMAALLRWLSRQRSEPHALGEEAQLRLESDENLVRILTIHRSKGLEYPVVFCPFLSEGPGRAKAQPEGLEYPLLTSQGSQRCVDFRDDSEAETAKGKKQAKCEEAAEGLRLIYVALTRAVDRCYLVIDSCQPGKLGKSSARALLHWLVAGGGDSQDWLEHGGLPEHIAAAWGEVASETSGILLSPISEAPQPPADDTAQTAPPDVKETPPRPPAPLSLAWRIDSFSGLVRGRHLENAAADRDAPVLSTEDRELDIAEDDILWFERGARAGECIHAVFEHADFSHPASWENAIDLALARHPPTRTSTASALNLSSARLQHMLQAVVHTPLPGMPAGQPFSLAHLSKADRLNEMEFTLPVGRLSATALTALCQRYGLPVSRLTFAQLQGYLRGFMDLVFRVRQADGSVCYGIIDWKSNFLGPRPEDYSQETIEAEMQAHGYYLQALMYTLALHRHLRCHLPDYDPARHLGGAWYLFVRGMRPDGQEQGILHWQVPAGLLEELEKLIERVGER